MKILLFPILAMMLILSTMTFATAQSNSTTNSSNDTLQSDNFSVKFASTIGSGGAVNLHTPQGIAVDSYGNIYVADRDNARIDKFDSKGNFLSIIGGTGGSADGQLLGPEAVAVDKSGNIYVVESNNARIDKFDSAGNFILKFGSKGNDEGQFNDPWGIAVDDSGNIFVADLFKPIQKFDSSGNFISTIGKGMIDGATSIALDKSGNLYALDNGNPQVVEFSNDGTFIKEWGSYCNLFHNVGCVDPDGSGPFANGDGQFQDPNGIAIDASGNVYLTDTGNNRVEVFDSSGYFIYKFGENGNGNAQFSDVMGIAVDNSGSLYVVDQNNHRVEAFNITYGNMTSAPNKVLTSPTMYPSAPPPTIPSIPAGYVSSFGSGGSKNGQFSMPQGIAVDSSGSLYVTDLNNDRVEKFDSNGNYISTIGSHGSADGQFSTPTGVALDKSGNVYVSDIDNYRIEKFDPAGNFVLKFGTSGIKPGQFNSLQGVAVDDAGNMYVADLTNSIQKFDPLGNFVMKIGHDKLNGVSDVAVDKSGDVYIVDSGNSQIAEYSSNGTLITKWGSYCDMSSTRGCIDPDGSGPFAIGDGQFQDPTRIAIDGSGKIYVTDQDNDRIQIFDSSGHFLYKFGSSGSDSGQFANPVGIAVDSFGNIYVADQNNARVQVFNLNNLGIAGFSSNTVASSLSVPSTKVIPPTTQPIMQPTAPPVTPQTTVVSVPTLSSMSSTIPVWVKGIFNYYGQGKISDNELIGAINFLVQQGIVKLK
ncbi:MAG: 6-bladed beta-propeller [Thaumarchaeota archaeon]|nr:6-bladed beta-propeller [Nitrososphaerota archaeon]